MPEPIDRKQQDAISQVRCTELERHPEHRRHVGECAGSEGDAEDDIPGLHASFQLSANGEQIGLFMPGGNSFVVIDTVSYIEQRTDWSYGREVDGGEEWIVFESPTPGESNTPEAVEIVYKALPDEFNLALPYPNPFNPQTTVTFSLPVTAMTRLTVFDISGSCVEVILNERIGAGQHLTTWNADRYAPGIYFLCLRQGGRYQIRKVTLVK